MGLQNSIYAPTPFAMSKGWQSISTTVNPMIPFVGYIVMSNAALLGYDDDGQAGDMYMATAQGYTITIISEIDNIGFGNDIGHTLLSTSTNASICLVCTGFSFLNVLFYTGTFTLT